MMEKEEYQQLTQKQFDEVMKKLPPPDECNSDIYRVDVVSEETKRIVELYFKKNIIAAERVGLFTIWLLDNVFVRR